MRRNKDRENNLQRVYFHCVRATKVIKHPVTATDAHALSFPVSEFEEISLVLDKAVSKLTSFEREIPGPVYE